MSTFSICDLNSFKEKGYVVIRNCFSRQIAESARDKLWQILSDNHGIEQNQSECWPQKCTPACSFKKEDGSPWSDVFTEKLNNGINQLLGDNRWEDFPVGWFMVTFPQCADSPTPESHESLWPDDSPSFQLAGKLHVDGHWYQHYPYSNEIGLIPMFCYSDVPAGSGGSAVVPGSHKIVANLLVQAGMRGLSSSDIASHFSSSVMMSDMEEVCVSAGDVVLMHPFLVHARTINHGALGLSSVRFMSHPSIRLKEPLCFSSLNAVMSDSTVGVSEYSPLEESIIEAMVDEDMLRTLKYLTPDVCTAFADRHNKTKHSKRSSSTIYASDSVVNVNVKSVINQQIPKRESHLDKDEKVGNGNNKKVRWEEGTDDKTDELPEIKTATDEVDYFCGGSGTGSTDNMFEIMGFSNFASAAGYKTRY